MEDFFTQIPIVITALASASWVAQAIIIIVLMLILLKIMCKYGVISLIVDKLKFKKSKVGIETHMNEIELTIKNLSTEIDSLLKNNDIKNSDRDYELISMISKLDISINRMDETLKELRIDIKARDILIDLNNKVDNMRDSAGRNW